MNRIILEYSDWMKWTSTSSLGGSVDTLPSEISKDPYSKNINYHLISKDKKFYGSHEVLMAFKNRSTKVFAKFDTGARTSSIGIEVARRLGVPEDIITLSTNLDSLNIPKDISKGERKELEQDLLKKYASSGVDSIEIVKSASGFSARPFISITIQYDGRILSTKANIKNRSGMTAEALVGLSDIL